MSGLYLDSSALAKLIIAEADSAAVRRMVTDRMILSSRVAHVEVAKAVARHNELADVTWLFERITWVELDVEMVVTASGAGGPQLRALDAIHVASALRVATDIEVFVTYDGRQAVAAEAAGLRVWSPAEDEAEDEREDEDEAEADDEDEDEDQPAP